MLGEIRQFWDKNEYKIVLILGFVLVSVISFEAGLLKGQKYHQKPVIIEKAANLSTEAIGAIENSSEGPNLAQGASDMPNPTNITPQNNTAQNCVFVGSKNSNKYHLPDCRWAKNIKLENRVCFSSAEEATRKGYQPDSNCIK